MEPVRNTSAPESIQPPQLPILRAHVSSDESSLQSCGSVSSCFNWIYSFLASIWHSLFGSAELPKKDPVFEELKNNPETLVDRLVKSADHGQAEYIQLFDTYAKINRDLLPSAEFDKFSNLYWKKTEPFHSIMQENKEFFIRLIFGGPDKTETFPDAPTDLLVSIAQDNALELIFEYPEKRVEILSLIQPTQELRINIQKETAKILSSLKSDSSDHEIDEAVAMLFRYQSVGGDNGLPVLNNPIPHILLNKLAIRLLTIYPVGDSSQNERREIVSRLAFFTLLPLTLLDALNQCATTLKTQPMPFMLNEIDSFIRNETGRPGYLNYDYLNDDIHSVFAQMYNAIPDNNITASEVKNALQGVKLNKYTLKNIFPDTPFDTAILDYNENESSIGCSYDNMPQDKNSRVYLVVIKNANQPSAPFRYAYYVFENNEDLNGHKSD